MQKEKISMMAAGHSVAKENTTEAKVNREKERWEKRTGRKWTQEYFDRSLLEPSMANTIFKSLYPEDKSSEVKVGGTITVRLGDNTLHAAPRTKATS